jgi:hypothetical protein
MTDLIVVEVAANEAEAELLCSLLRSADISCLHRVTNRSPSSLDEV